VNRPDIDVVVVGAGPVGMALAILLGQRGHRVEIRERHAAPYGLPRAVHVDHEAMRILERCGVADDLRPFTEPAGVYEWRNAAGEVLLRFSGSGIAPTGFPASSMVCQPDLERLLETRLDELPTVTFRRGVEVTDVPVADEARFVVGCDGANSTIRAALGVPFTDLGFFHEWLILDVILHEPRVFEPNNVQVCDPMRPTTMVSGGPGRRRWEFMRRPDEDPAWLADPATAWALLAPHDVHPGNARLERQAIYTFQARWADRWRDARVFLAGDAAHQMPPFAGQGMCSGLRDAANLAWRLDAVLDGRLAGAPAEGVLDDYQRERLPHVRATIDTSMGLGAVICIADPDEAATRDRAMIEAAAGRGTVEMTAPIPTIADGTVLRGSPAAGTVARRFASEPTVSNDDPGWRLWTDAEQTTPLELAEWWQRWGRSVVSRDATIPTLVRPDGIVWGTASDGIELLIAAHHALG
jgi:2-polyprenyl-6-methoxyphenol hydroxylase-like FAD-dependent oxidoreductase